MTPSCRETESSPKEDIQRNQIYKVSTHAGLPKWPRKLTAASKLIREVLFPVPTQDLHKRPHRRDERLDMRKPKRKKNSHDKTFDTYIEGLADALGPLRKALLAEEIALLITRWERSISAPSTSCPYPRADRTPSEAVRPFKLSSCNSHSLHISRSH